MTGAETSTGIVSVVVEIAEAVADSTVVAVVVRVAKAEEEDKHQFGNEAICRCANENSSLNTNDDYGPGRISTTKLRLRRTLHRSEQ